MLSRLTLSAVLLLVAIPAAADDGDAYMCRNGLFPSDKQTVTLMHATGKPRTYFLWDKDTKGCPSDVKVCRNSYVLPGQQVLAGKRANGFVCAFYPNNSGGSAGWVPLGNLAPEPAQPNPNPALRDWVGHWKDGDNTLSITATGDALKVSGAAFWTGDGGPANMHDGEIEARAKPRQAHVDFSEETCRVSATLLGPYLIVSDNSECGGMNVRFDGVYRRSTAR